MARLIAITAVLATLTLAACGGGGDSTTTTPPPHQTVAWTRCPGRTYLTSVAGISCNAAERFIQNEGLGKADTGGRPGTIIQSDPRNFTAKPFECTNFPMVTGDGWHAICNHGDQHVSSYITP
jgi:hypothetical protein